MTGVEIEGLIAVKTVARALGFHRVMVGDGVH
jgi:hypothetical protein